MVEAPPDESLYSLLNDQSYNQKLVDLAKELQINNPSFNPSWLSQRYLDIQQYSWDLAQLDSFALFYT